jgi:hypothetical protein
MPAWDPAEPNWNFPFPEPPWPEEWMVVRQAFGGHYWETISFGPMTRAAAVEMTSGQYGGAMVHVSNFKGP